MVELHFPCTKCNESTDIVACDGDLYICKTCFDSDYAKE